jgi:hypothetical protein
MEVSGLDAVEKKKQLFPMPGIEHKLISHSAHSLITISAEL